MDSSTSITNTSEDKINNKTGEYLPENKNVNRSSRISAKMIILILFIAALFFSNLFFIYKYIKAIKYTDLKEDINPSITNYQLTPQPTTKFEVNSTRSKQGENYYSLNERNIVNHAENNKYPYKIDLATNFVPRDVWSVSINSLDDLRKFYQEAAVEGCPGACSTLIEGDNLEKQFSILSKISTQTNCELTDSVKNELENFILFAGGIETKELIGLIYNNNLKTCGLRYVGQDGYDYWLGNYEYEAGFFKDNKIIEIRFELFPVGKYKEIDTIWKDLGYNFDDDSFEAENYGKMDNYMKNINLKEGPINSIIEIYDSFVKSFKFVE